MYRFYVDGNAIGEEEIVLTGEDNNHIRNVLRMHEGEEITVCDGRGTDYRCSLLQLDRDQVRARILSSQTAKTELPVKLVLYQGMPKKDKLELIIQKAVELGAAEVVPVMMHRTIVRLEDPKKEEKKRERWQSIARAAAMQSMRGVIPQVKPVVSYAQALQEAAGLDAVLVPYEQEEGIDRTRAVLQELKEKKVRSVGVFIGPEGGFEESEIVSAREAGAIPITLGHRILRTETAGLAALTLLMFAFETA